VDMHVPDLVGMNGITRDLIAHIQQRDMDPRGHVLHLLLPKDEYLPYIECSFCRLVRSPEHLIGRHCGISRQTEGHSFGDHLISESVSVKKSTVIEASFVLCSV
jgi:hypothetical protein